MATKVAVVMYDERMYQGRGHLVFDWAVRIKNNFVMWAKEEAPIRSGELREKISGEATRTGVRQLNVTIESAAPHTIYVIKGTTGPIMSNRMWGFRNNPRYASVPGGLPRGGRIALRAPGGGFMGYRQNMDWLAANGYALRVRAGNGYPERYMLSVNGQEPNNFMAAAARRVGARHSSLRGFEPTVAFWDRG